MYRCRYIWLFSRSVGAGSAATRNTRGLTLSVIRLITPPFPAVSRPSNTTHTLAPDATTHCWRWTSSTWSRASSRSYSLRDNFPARAPIAVPWADAISASFVRCFFLAFFFFAIVAPDG